MENKNVGYLILGIAVLLIVIIFLYDNVLKEVIVGSCGIEHSLSCPMTQSVNQQTYLSLAIVGLLVVIALVLIFSKPHERVVIQEKKVRVEVPEKKKKIDTSSLNKDEKKVIELLQKENGTMFQADLMEKIEIGKVGMTRLLDKLEAKQFIERKRRGMNNVVVLRN